MSAGANQRIIKSSSASTPLHSNPLQSTPRFSDSRISVEWEWEWEWVQSSFSSLLPYYVTGFSDGESSFHISISKNKNYRSGFQIQAIYTTQLHIKDLELLKKIQSFFGGVGSIVIKKGSKSAIFSVQKILVM